MNGAAIYDAISFPEPPEDRPYTFINMVSTIDGKTISGTEYEPVSDLGSDLDHELMRRLEDAADGVLIGAGALRSVPGLWYEKDKFRVVATKSGNVDFNSRFFQDAPAKAIVICPEEVRIPQLFHKLTNDFTVALRDLRSRFGIRVLAIEGGSKLNAQLLELDLVDELFLTIAPKVKLGECIPTYAGGNPLPRENLQAYSLVEHHSMGDELFLRYRRKR